MAINEQESVEKFDFPKHEQAAVSAYLRVASFYSDLATAIKGIAEEALESRGIKLVSIEARAKDPTSFGRKAAKPSESDPSKPKYTDPLNQITDQAGVRIIAFLPRTIKEIEEMIRSEFEVIEHFDKGESLIEEGRFGYRSVHYLIKMAPKRFTLPEYKRFESSKVEIQVRTILQHTWAEIEHNIQYKSSLTIPRDIKRRFMSLAGMLELADREFQAIQDADRDLTEQAENSISAGNLLAVEITPNSLKRYLDKRLGSDGRMSDFTYDWTARLLIRLGFTSLDQVDHCIGSYDGDQLSRLVDGKRLGQVVRLEYMLLAAMGEKFIERHPWRSESWFPDSQKHKLQRFTSDKVEVGTYDPLSPP